MEKNKRGQQQGSGQQHPKQQGQGGFQQRSSQRQESGSNKQFSQQQQGQDSSQVGSQKPQGKRVHGDWNQQGSQKQSRKQVPPQRPQGAGYQSHQRHDENASHQMRNAQQQGVQRQEQHANYERHQRDGGPPQQRQRQPQQRHDGNAPCQMGNSQQQGRQHQQQRADYDRNHRRPNQGGYSSKQGGSQEVEVNYLAMNLDKMPPIAYHYDVTIKPDRAKKFLRPVFDRFQEENYINIPMAYDGVKSAYTVEQLNIDEAEKTVKIADDNGREMEFTVEIKPTENLEIDLSSLRTYFKDRIFDKPMRALQCLEVVLASPCQNKGKRVGRSFFVQPRQRTDLRDGYELWTGIYQAAILGDKPFFNVDISHKSFPSEMWVLDLLRSYSNFDENRPLDGRTMENLSQYLNGLRITYIPPKQTGFSPRSYSFVGITEKTATDYIFMKENVKSTVVEHFKSMCVNLKYPNLNCLLLGIRQIAVPIEFCFIAGGQAVNKKDGATQVQQMIRYAATSTDERKRKIMDLLHMFQHNASQVVKTFGITIGDHFIRIPMRLLNPPLIEYASGKICTVVNGSWRADDASFLKTVNIQHKWAVIWSDRSRVMNSNVAHGLAKQILQAAQALKVCLDEKPAAMVAFKRVDDTLRELQSKQFQLVIVVLSNFGTTYAEVKQTAELKYGVLTQCIKEETVNRRLNYQLALNLLLKINAKLNGTNHKISGTIAPSISNVMYLGADVTHPSPDQQHIPSVVGVAASHDEFGACYNMQYRLQKGTCEDIQNMCEITRQHLLVYREKLGRFPDHILYYRDGVSDGQFKIVQDSEIKGIRAACSGLGVKAKITCLIVVKRHHTRFFPLGASNPRDKFHNVTPGTVVDKVIVHPNEMQFFMVSHQSIQGTAKPTRYNVLDNDSKLSIEVLQNITHNLCHLFPRCNRAVSYPAPAYLAHLVAYRGRVYIDGINRFGNLKEEYKRRQVKDALMKSNPMYFV